MVIKLNIGLLALTIFSISIWHLIKPLPFSNFTENPLLFIFPIIYLGGLFGTFFIKKYQKNVYAFICSSLIIVGGITSSLASMFPVILPSTNNVNESLTIYNTAASQYGLSVALGWGIIGFILLFIYIIVQKRLMGGKIDHMDYGH